MADDKWDSTGEERTWEHTDTETGVTQRAELNETKTELTVTITKPDDMTPTEFEQKVNDSLTPTK